MIMNWLNDATIMLCTLRVKVYGLEFKGALQSVCKQSLCLHFCVQNIELYSTTIYIFKLLEYNKWSRNNNQAFQEPKT
jgi:hypothetical protein